MGFAYKCSHCGHRYHSGHSYRTGWSAHWCKTCAQEVWVWPSDPLVAREGELCRVDLAGNDPPCGQQTVKCFVRRFYHQKLRKEIRLNRYDFTEFVCPHCQTKGSVSDEFAEGENCPQCKIGKVVKLGPLI